MQLQAVQSGGAPTVNNSFGLSTSLGNSKEGGGGKERGKGRMKRGESREGGREEEQGRRVREGCCGVKGQHASAIEIMAPAGMGRAAGEKLTRGKVEKLEARPSL